jgi:hypothetical protein
MGEETLISRELMIVGMIAVALLGAAAFGLYWFFGRREGE